MDVASGRVSPLASGLITFTSALSAFTMRMTVGRIMMPSGRPSGSFSPA